MPMLHGVLSPRLHVGNPWSSIWAPHDALEWICIVHWIHDSSVAKMDWWINISSLIYSLVIHIIYVINYSPQFQTQDLRLGEVDIFLCIAMHNINLLQPQILDLVLIPVSYAFWKCIPAWMNSCQDWWLEIMDLSMISEYTIHNFLNDYYMTSHVFGPARIHHFIHGLIQMHAIETFINF